MEDRRNGIRRATVAGIALVVQVSWIYFMFYRLSSYYQLVTVITQFLSVVLALKVYGKHTNANIKMPWMFFLLVLPLAGVIFYTLFGSRFSRFFTKRRYKSIYGIFDSILISDRTVLNELRERDKVGFGQSYYISKHGKMPPYKGNKIRYFSEAYEGIAAQNEDMKIAKNFIFMEYHAIEDSESFREIEDILVQKVKEGVDVRILYDDMGSIGFVNTSFTKKLKKKGINCRVFNPVIPILNIFMNNRDHRKITVIDGKIAYTGGYNIADEYFNIVNPYGYWKDTGVRIEGKAVDNFTIMFLEMWNSIKFDINKKEHIDRLLNQADYFEGEEGIVQPFSENPLYEEKVSRNAYINLAKSANDYLYIMTPYLIIDDLLNDELTMAAKRGVDVRIITPGIPDKKIIYSTTRSYYAALAREGVRIFEYTPGFMHAKQHIVDDKYAIIGTINLDYRSLYLHFENGVFIADNPVILEMKKDFENVFEQSEEVTHNYSSDRSTVLRIRQCILRLFSPLL
ncbi:MAG: cardiolipin synthase [Peptostreptococcus porci]|nr:cardiolipin synthase [Peptostreptococcus porci]